MGKVYRFSPTTSHLVCEQQLKFYSQFSASIPDQDKGFYTLKEVYLEHNYLDTGHGQLIV